MNRRILTLVSAILTGLFLSAGSMYACQKQAGYSDMQQGFQQLVSKATAHYGRVFVHWGRTLLDENSVGSIQGVSPAMEISPTQAVWEMLGQVNQDRALNDLRQLTGEEPICVGGGCYTITNRLTGSEGLHRATDYISTELVGLGYAVEFQDWSRSGYSDRNLIARKPGRYSPTEQVYLVAHVDGVGTGNERFPAADDDASGAVDNLELARILSSYTFSRTVVLLFTAGEEQGTLGVQSYLDQLSPQELGSIKYAVDVDMVGYDGNGDSAMELWYGSHSPSLALTQMMSETIRAYQLDLAPTFVVGCG